MNILFSRRLAAILILLLASLFGCTSATKTNRALLVTSEIILPSLLDETSGLYCPTNEAIFTINDSGNTPVLFEINTKGEIKNERLLDAKNKDWEAISGNNQHFYIGDIGNNAGKRQDLNLIQLDKVSGQISTIKFTYANNEIENNEYVKHDFDAEALVSAQNSLYLLSKSWQSNKLYIYKFDTQVNEQVLVPYAVTTGLPGVVTGADYNPRTNEFVVVGYSVNAFKIFSPFVAVLNEDFKLIETIALKGFQQIEGICISPNGAMWISQERSYSKGAKLFKVALTK